MRPGGPIPRMSLRLLEEALDSIDAAIDALRRYIASVERGGEGSEHVDRLEDLVLALEDAADTLDSLIRRVGRGGGEG